MCVCTYIYTQVYIAPLCPALCDPMDYSPPGSSVHGIFQARMLKWVAFPSPGDLPNAEMEPESPARAGRFFTTEPPGKPHAHVCMYTHIYNIDKVKHMVFFWSPGKDR